MAISAKKSDMDGNKDTVIAFTINDQPVEAMPGETIWQAAKRYNIDIPHLCYRPEKGYRSDGNCRACSVEIDGERVLAASCLRTATQGMKVHTASARALHSQKMVFELLATDQPEKEKAHDANSLFWQWHERLEVQNSRFEAKSPCHIPLVDTSHAAMNVALDACIHCNLCVRACREVQVNDVIGMAGRGSEEKIIFDFDDPMGDSTCVACGECVQACPTGALMPSSLIDENGYGRREADKTVESVCPYCGVGCQLTYHMRDNKIAWVDGREGPANENRLCVKGRFGFDYIHNPQRLTMPLIRKEGIAKNLDVDPANPYTHFRQASWEEAMTRIGSTIKDIKKTYSSNAFAGFGSAKCSNEEAYLFQKLIRTGMGTNNVDHCTRLCHASSVAALLETIGSGAVTAPFTAVRDSEVIIVIGANSTENHPVAATYFKQAVKRGARLYVMDPRKNGLARHATHMLDFKPGTDVALLNAMMHVIVKEKLYNSQYINHFTEGFAKLEKHLENFSPEKMSLICGISPTLIEEVARDYAQSKASIIFWGMGVSQHVHGTDNARCLISLALMTGQIGKPGSGLHPLRGQNNVQGASDSGLIPMFFPDYSAVGNEDIRKQFENAWDTKLDPNKGLTVVEIMDAIHADTIKAMYIMGENPAMSDPDLNHAREALSKLSFLVVQDIFLTETAMYADVILPASAWPEKNGTVTNTNRQVQMGRKALDAPGEAKEDWRIIVDIANAIDLNWRYDDISEVFQEMASVMPSLNNITWDRLMQEHAVTYPCAAPDEPGQDIVFSNGFVTESGLGKFVPADIISPDELPDKDYPIILTTGRQLEHWHTGSMTRRATFLDAIEPIASVSINPEEMVECDINAGDTIRIVTRRGAIELIARADHAIAKGMIFIPFAYVEAAANILTNPKLDPFGKIPEFKFCAARIERLS